ncbi:sensor histidine kinase [Gordonia sp. CPCC 205333]|uniref:sensor histidine kinase n=1 Tax=Gordonia sp. CPCC 205333 TaxID=3140790 RepID=UPI003AF3B0C3
MNSQPAPSSLSIALHLLGVGVVLWSLTGEDRPLWVDILAYLAVGAWLVSSVGVRVVERLVPARQTNVGAEIGCALVATSAGGLASAGTSGLALVPAVIAVGAVIGTAEYPLLWGVFVGALGIVTVGVGAVVADISAISLLAMMGGIVIAALLGLSRRQTRISDDALKLLREREFAARDEARRVALARDLHDLLAHSLGGLVIQLDAVEALLESGKSDAAAERVGAARTLAAQGLGEARRAVAALRDPGIVGPDVDSAAVLADIEDLLAAHRSVGGIANLGSDGHTDRVPANHADIIRRTIQESLSNARKHASGSPVSIEVHWHDGLVSFTVTNPLSVGTALAASGGGHGLLGMRERFIALDNGSSLVAEEDSRIGKFRVTALLRMPGTAE